MPKSAQVKLWFSLKVLVLVSNYERFGTMDLFYGVIQDKICIAGLINLARHIDSVVLQEKYLVNQCLSVKSTIESINIMYIYFCGSIRGG